MPETKESEKLRAIGASSRLVKMAEQREAQETNPDEFVIYAEGLVHASVCSSLPFEQVKARMAAIPSGTMYGWQPSDAAEFRTGQPNPCPCDEKPATHKHFLFSC